ncbi:MAG: hypothetical protein COT16_03020 [Elusimicrobia bacterium CG08_land_8_20_14_0_20_44_26]|nr:MAG: hypothetical protein COT16_03020 [Elusimicrobia bacterium CG08_land_8_20_14_0_20_44_26]
MKRGININLGISNGVKRRILFLAASALAALAVYAGREIYIAKTTERIALVYTSDIHGHILPEKHYDASSASSFETGGFGSLQTFLKTVKDPFILLDAGDLFMGAPEGALGKGEIVVELMKRLGYRAVAVGNHELDYGAEHFKKLALAAGFPFICCNLKSSDGSEIPYIKPYAIFNAGDCKVGVTAVIEEDLAKVIAGETASLFSVGSASSSLRSCISALKNDCDIIVVLSGLGLENDIKLAKSARGIDIIAGGETHIALKKAVRVERTLVCEPGWGLQYVGRVDMLVGKRGIVRARWRLCKLLASAYPPTGIVKNILPQYETEEYRTLNDEVGWASEWILRSPATNSPATPMGNLIADIMRYASGAEFAFQNLYGIRDDIPAGVVRKKDLASVSPFGNRILTMKMTGSEVREVMKQSATMQKGLLQISGLKMIFNSAFPEDRRLLNVLVNGGDIDPEKEYTVATNSFVAIGGDGFTAFLKGAEIKDTGITLLEAEVKYFREKSPVKPPVDQRIIDIKE